MAIFEHYMLHGHGNYKTVKFQCRHIFYYPHRGLLSDHYGTTSKVEQNCIDNDIFLYEANA